MSTEKEQTFKPLVGYFLIAFLMPIAATAYVVFTDGLQQGLVTNQISPKALIVVFAMVHSPTIAALLVTFLSDGVAGIKDLLGALKHWRFSPGWYAFALLFFPLAILVSLTGMLVVSEAYMPAFFISAMVLATVLSTLWEEIGWIGFATPRMLRIFSPLRCAVVLGVIHTFWHLAADFWGAGVFFGKLYPIRFLLWMVGLVILRIIIMWIYVRTKSVVLGWFAHLGYTGGQLLLVPLSLTAAETVLWNVAFAFVLLVIVGFLYVLNRDFREFTQISRELIVDN